MVPRKIPQTYMSCESKIHFVHSRKLFCNERSMEQDDKLYTVRSPHEARITLTIFYFQKYE